MGQEFFVSVVMLPKSIAAFNMAVEHAKETEGCGIYTGSIGEKADYVKDSSYKGKLNDAEAIIAHIENLPDQFEDNEAPGAKWGPALCLMIGRLAAPVVARHFDAEIYIERKVQHAVGHVFYGYASY